MKISAGFVVIQNNKILLEHPTNSKWKGTLSIPKGEVKEGEKLFDAAIREFQEELGININIDRSNEEPDGYINYTKNDKIYKRVYYFIVEPEEYIEIDNNKLQKEEVDWAGFLTKQEAEERIFWRFLPLLKHLK